MTLYNLYLCDFNQRRISDNYREIIDFKLKKTKNCKLDDEIRQRRTRGDIQWMYDRSAVDNAAPDHSRDFVIDVIANFDDVTQLDGVVAHFLQNKVILIGGMIATLRDLNQTTLGAFNRVTSNRIST